MEKVRDIVSQNNQQNALPSGLGGVSLQTYDYDAMNRLIHSSGGNSDAGVSYDFQQTYSPSGRIGDKFCDFTHSDHLGSSSWTTDVNGHAIQHIEYLPFGEEFVNQRLTPYEDRYTFTGKELDAESNLYYYDARYNSSTYSQFNSPDPMSDKYPSVSPYLYCAGNPMMYVDPTGMEVLNEMDENTDPDLFEAAEIFNMLHDDKKTIMIFAHGDNEGMILCNSTIIRTPQELEQFLEEYSSLWKEKDEDSKPNIILYSCNTGKGDNSFAEKCGTYFGLKYCISVIAPTKDIVINHDNCTVIGTFDKDNIKTNKDLNRKNSGQWKMCGEDGTITSYPGTGPYCTPELIRNILHFIE